MRKLLLTQTITVDGSVEMFEISSKSPDELGTIALVTRLPPLSIAPTEAHGQLAAFITLVWCGDPDEGERQVDRLRQLAQPVLDQVKLRHYPEMYSLIPDVPQSVTTIASTMMADSLDDHAIKAILQAFGHPEDPGEPVLSAVGLRSLGGAIARVPREAPAFAHRLRQVVCSVVTAGFEPSRADHHRAWVRTLTTKLAHLSKGIYVNFVDDIDKNYPIDVYPPETFVDSPR